MHTFLRSCDDYFPKKRQRIAHEEKATNERRKTRKRFVFFFFCFHSSASHTRQDPLHKERIRESLECLFSISLGRDAPHGASAAKCWGRFAQLTRVHQNNHNNIFESTTPEVLVVPPSFSSPLLLTSTHVHRQENNKPIF